MNTPKITRVSLRGWGTSRSIIEENGRVSFEVAEDEHHCEICASRISHVRAVVNAKSELDARFERRETNYSYRTLFVSLPACPEGKDVRQYVAESLDLPIIY